MQKRKEAANKGRSKVTLLWDVRVGGFLAFSRLRKRPLFHFVIGFVRAATIRPGCRPRCFASLDPEAPARRLAFVLLATRLRSHGLVRARPADSRKRENALARNSLDARHRSLLNWMLSGERFQREAAEGAAPAGRGSTNAQAKRTDTRFHRSVPRWRVARIAQAHRRGKRHAVKRMSPISQVKRTERASPVRLVRIGSKTALVKCWSHVRHRFAEDSATRLTP
jgi:hypothetical protein